MPEPSPRLPSPLLQELEDLQGQGGKAPGYAAFISSCPPFLSFLTPSHSCMMARGAGWKIVSIFPLVWSSRALPCVTASSPHQDSTVGTTSSRWLVSNTIRSDTTRVVEMDTTPEYSSTWEQVKINTST